jgi:hypothetical protein
MKNKYPGLRKSYYNGYNELIEKDFFGTSEIDVNKIRFIDRLNIFAKSGQRELIEFNNIEKEFITRSDKLETWADVVKLTKDIYAYSQEEQFDEEEQEQLSDMSVNVNQDQDGEEQDSQEGDSHEQQEQNEETSSSSGSDSDRPEDKEDKVDNKSSSQSNEKDTQKEKEEKQKDVGSGSGAGYDPNLKQNQNVSATDTNYQNNAETLSKTDSKTHDNVYLTFPKLNSAVIEYDVISKLIEKSNRIDFPMSKRLTEWKEFKNKCMRSVNYMAKEFEMKKRADAYTRTRTARTGVINTNILHSYKYNDDIFARIQIEPGAKNHGMIMIVDWSGSMGDKMYDTLCQTINLVLFCKAVNIPFEVYAFSDTNVTNFNEEHSRYGKYGVDSEVFKYTKSNEKTMEECSLIQFVTSDMRVAKFNEAMANLYQIAKANSSTHIREYNMRYMQDTDISLISLPHQLRLGGTPLDSAILCSIDVVNKFKSKNKIQKMNTVFLTDGSGHTNHNYTEYDQNGNLSVGGYGRHDVDINIKDGSYSFKYGRYHRGHHFSYHKPMLDYFKHKTGSTVIGYYVAGKTIKYWDIMTFTNKEGYEQYDIAKANIRKNKCHTITNIGYDEFFIIPKHNLKIQDEDASITTDMTASKMKQQFLKNFKTKKVSRVLLNKFVERIA